MDIPFYMYMYIGYICIIYMYIDTYLHLHHTLRVQTASRSHSSM